MAHASQTHAMAAPRTRREVVGELHAEFAECPGRASPPPAWFEKVWRLMPDGWARQPWPRLLQNARGELVSVKEPTRQRKSLARWTGGTLNRPASQALLKWFCTTRDGFMCPAPECTFGGKDDNWRQHKTGCKPLKLLCKKPVAAKAAVPAAVAVSGPWQVRATRTCGVAILSQPPHPRLVLDHFFATSAHAPPHTHSRLAIAGTE